MVILVAVPAALVRHTLKLIPKLGAVGEVSSRVEKKSLQQVCAIDKSNTIGN